jgi:hypothetical protein
VPTFRKCLHGGFDRSLLAACANPAIVEAVG